MKLFEPEQFGALVPRRIAGFKRPIPSICYRGAELGSPFPMGGIATGYIELRGDGRLGHSSIYNSYVPPMQLGGALLSLISADGSTTPLDADHADIAMLGHFPVCNVRLAPRTGPIIWLRAFTTILPGDADGSNTPGVIFEITSEADAVVRLAMDVGHNVEPIVQGIDLPEELGGAARRYHKRDDYRCSLVLAAIDDEPVQSSQAADDRAAFALVLQLRGGLPRRAVFAWHVPWWIDTGGEPHLNRYASRFDDAVAVAQHLRRHHGSILRRTLAWQSAIYDSGQPDWITNALVQSLYSYAKNTLWVDERRPDRWYEPNGLFVHSESFRGCPINETVVCRQHGHLPTLLLWPDLERSTLAGLAHYQLRDGEIPFSFGQPNALRDPRYHCQHPLTSSQFVQQVHRYLAATNDEQFVKRLWPNVDDAMRHAMSLDVDGDSLVDEHPHALRGDNWPANQFYDQWPWRGTSTYVAGTGLAALRAHAAMADRLGHREAHDASMRRLGRGLESFHARLWNGRYFRLWHDPKLGGNETCLANQLMGQWCCRIAGLDPLFDGDTCRSAYEAIDELNAQPTKFGLINGGNFQGDPTTAGDAANNHGVMIFIAENLCAAMTGMYEGYGPAAGWAETLVRTIHEHQAMPFDQFCLIRHDTGAPAWGNDYYSNLVVWALPMARERIGLRAFAGGMIGRIRTAATTG